MSESNGYATREGLFSKTQRRFKDIDHPEYGKHEIQSLNDLEKSSFDAAAVNSKGKLNRIAAINSNARLIVIGCSKPKFTRDDVPQIQQLDAGYTEWLAKEIRQHCGFDEEPEKNSETTDSDASHSS
jgi:hypothetical protein